MKHHYPFIDGLRAVAVLPVIFFHYNLAHLTGGYVGVDVFFVLSGFLITGLIFGQMKEGHFSIVHFYERRARRILPALFVTCGLSLAVALMLYLPHDFKQFSRTLVGIALFGSNFIFARWNGYFADPLSTVPLLHTWSLAVEEQFYVFFPLILWAISTYARNRLFAVRCAFYGLFLLSFVLSVIQLHTMPEKTFYLLHTRAWELLAGALLALHLKDLRLSQLAAEVMSGAGVVILLLCFFLYDRNTSFPGPAAVPPCLATVFLLWSNMSHETMVKKILSGKLFVGIGMISYGLYLYHWPVLVFDRYYFDQEPAGLRAVFLIALTFCMALLSYVYIEAPIRDGHFLRRKPLFILSGTMLLAFGVVGALGVYTNGFPARLNPAVLKYAEAGENASATPIPQKCDNLVYPGVSGDQVCKFGAVLAGHPDFLLWGDSHAASLGGAVEAEAMKHGLTGWSIIRTGCPPMFDADRADHFVDYSCPAISDAVLDTIHRNNIKNVLLIARWDMYALGWEKGSVETAREPFISYTTSDGRTLTREAAFAASFRHTIATLDAMGVTIWIVKQVPPQLVYVSSAMAKAQFLGRNPDYLQRSYADILKRRGAIDAVFDDVAKSYPLHFIDPADKFCPDKKTCLIAADGQPLYMDNTHLSSYGALWSEDMLNAFFITVQPLQK
jgi:peptidoglycan/LPS O-acetylase OafA/YrhL